MANLFKWWVKFKVEDRKKKKTWITDVKNKKVITSAGKVFQTTSGSLKCAGGSLRDPRVNGSPCLKQSFMYAIGIKLGFKTIKTLSNHR